MEELPLWFLLGSLVVPRLALLLGYFVADSSPIVNLHGLVAPTLGALVPRVLVIIVIFQDRGLSPWLLVHAIAMAVAYIVGVAVSSEA